MDTNQKGRLNNRELTHELGVLAGRTYAKLGLYLNRNRDIFCFID